MNDIEYTLLVNRRKEALKYQYRFKIKIISPDGSSMYWVLLFPSPDPCEHYGIPQSFYIHEWGRTTLVG